MLPTISDVLYHGTAEKFQKIDVLKGRNNKDFGKGFYMAVTKSQAIGMMHKKFREAVLRRPNAPKGTFSETLYEIKIDREGNAEGEIRVNAVRPYVGLGYGRLVPKGRVGFRVELGCQFMGKMKVYQDDQELDVDKALKDKGSDDISKIIDKLTVYPVLKFTLTGRIL